MSVLAENFEDIFSINPDFELPEFRTIRLAVKEVIEKITATASVYPFYELEFDPNTLLRKVTPLLKGKGADQEIFHAWMCGITSARIKRGEAGEGEFAGNYAFTFELTLEIEGFFDINSDDPYQTAENESEKITTLFFFNQDRILDNVHFGQLDFNSIDEEYFADGNKLVVVSGSCLVDFQITIEA